MRKSTMLVLVTATSLAAMSPVWAQTSERTDRARSRPSSQKDSHFYIKGPNAPVQNQQRKFTDPLNANGGR